MEYNIKIIKVDKFKLSNWSGGTTTEMFIYPENSKYTEKNFKWRISSATIDSDVSNFTNLPGISRELMVIQGSTTLEHANHYSVDLKPFDKDSFKGEWTTKSYGSVVDFNLMTTDGCIGKINCLVIESRKQFKLSFKVNNNQYKKQMKYYYSPQQDFLMVANNQNYLVNKKELVCITKSEKSDLSEVYILNSTSEDKKIIETIVYY